MPELADVVMLATDAYTALGLVGVVAPGSAGAVDLCPALLTAVALRGKLLNRLADTAARAVLAPHTVYLHPTALRAAVRGSVQLLPVLLARHQL